MNTRCVPTITMARFTTVSAGHGSFRQGRIEQLYVVALHAETSSKILTSSASQHGEHCDWGRCDRDSSKTGGVGFDPPNPNPKAMS